MDHPRVSALERAFQLARSGGVATIKEIKRRLNREGYEVEIGLSGPMLKAQLRGMMREAIERKGGAKTAPGDEDRPTR